MRKISVAACLLLGLFAAYSASQHASAKASVALHAELLQDYLETMNSVLPRQINKTVLLTHATILDKTITFHFVIDSDRYPYAFRNEFGISTMNTLLFFVCDAEFDGELITDKALWHFSFKNQSGRDWGLYEIKPEFCEAD